MLPDDPGAWSAWLDAVLARRGRATRACAVLRRVELDSGGGRRVLAAGRNGSACGPTSLGHASPRD